MNGAIEETACNTITFTMELSSVFNRIYFLLELKQASPDVRIFMLQNITPGQLACIGEIARRIYHQTFPLLAQDVTYFDDRSLVLRVLFSLRVSFRRKVVTLLRYHRFIGVSDTPVAKSQRKFLLSNEHTSFIRIDDIKPLK